MIEAKPTTCHHCKNELVFEVKMQRTDSCVHCGWDLHCCKNCRQYDPGAHNQCREPIAEYVYDRERANHCTFFEFLAGDRPHDDSADKSRAKLAALFAKK